jgi:hypothetical protein
MKQKDDLPVIRNKKRIDPKKFEALAKRVRKILDEEEEWLRQHGHCDPTRFPLGA